MSLLIYPGKWSLKYQQKHAKSRAIIVVRLQSTYVDNWKKGQTMSSNNQLKALVERIEKLEEERTALADDVKSVFSEAKANGFDPKIIKKVLALRKKDASKRAEEQALLSVYMDALGMLADTPLGKAAMDRAAVTVDENDDSDFE
jgi:uncharacterized protein (UPF0335 family)